MRFWDTWEADQVFEISVSTWVSIRVPEKWYDLKGWKYVETRMPVFFLNNEKRTSA